MQGAAMVREILDFFFKFQGDGDVASGVDA